MAKASTRNSISTAASSSGFILKAAPGSKKRVVVTRPQTYDEALNAAAKHFPSIPKEDIILQSDELDLLPGELVDIDPGFWTQAVASISSVYVVRSEMEESSHASFLSESVLGKPLTEVYESGAVTTPHHRNILPAVAQTHHHLSHPSSALGHRSQSDGYSRIIHATLANGEVVNLKVKPKATISSICQHIEHTIGKEADSVTLQYDGRRLFCNARVCDIDWSESENEPIHVDVYLQQLGGKPAIYLFSPIEMDALVNLSLVPSWRFSTIYPIVPTKSTALSHETLTWNVHVYGDGSLTEKTTGLDVAYLYWEAHTNSDAPPSPPPSPLPGQNASIEHFCPNSSDLDDHNAVVLPVASLTPYLDKALKSLGLHTEARTSFITYWLPSFLKHNHIALRFVPQAAYERAAPLDISPAPAVSTRVFMLFKGVCEGNLDLWQEAQARADDDVAMWRDVVGVDIEKASDETLFRVLEWGGMEVLRG